jgi:multidrug efflux pump subunit AcrB
MGFAKLLSGQARALVMVALALAVAGVAASFSLPVGLFPQTSFPRVVIDLDAGDRPADQTALLLTRPVEEAVRAVPGVQDVRSDTTRGSAQISVDFGWGRDMGAATLNVDAAIARVLPTLPPGATYGVRRMDPTVYPIIAYALTSDRLTPVQLRDLATLQITPLLSAIPGLSRVEVQGGGVAEVEISADPHRLAAYDLSLADLAAAVAAGNTLKAVGRVQDRDKLFLVLAHHTLTSAADVGAIVVRSDPTGLVRVRDVATVSDGQTTQWMHVSEDGKPAVLFNVYEQPDGNAVNIAAAVRAKLAAYPLPAGVRLVNWYDQSQLVTQSAASVRDAVLIGLVLAAVVLMVFLRSWRVTLIAMLVVPATLATTVLVLSLLGMSFNIMTLGGVAAAVGLLIDDVIVMVEHIARRAGAPKREGSDAPTGRDAVLPAAREFMAPLTGSSLATLIVFVPLSFLTGVTGAFSKALSITMAAALVISYLLTAFIVPILARSLIDFGKWRDPGADGWLERQHGRLLGRLFARPWILALIAVPLAILGFIAFRAAPTGFMPQVDEGGFVMDYYTKPGASVIETEREISQVDAILRATPEVLTFSRRLGTGLGGDLGQSYHGDYFVRLKDRRGRSTEALMAAVREKVEAEVPGVDVELAQLMEDLIGDLTAVPQPIEIKLYAADPAILGDQAQKVADAIGKLHGVVEVKSGLQLAGDALDVKIDPVRAGFEGVSPDEVTQAVDQALNGAVATTLATATKGVDVRVRMTGAVSLRVEDLSALPIRAKDGHLFPLSQVSDITAVTGQPQISRENLQPMVAVTGRIEGRGVGAAITDVKRALARPGLLAPGVRYELGGLYQQQQIAFVGLTRVFGAALAAEFVLLLVLYRRFWTAAIVVGCSLFSTTAVFIALWLTHVELNITALMGMTMIIGIGAEMAIFYVSEWEALRGHLPADEALGQASRNRLRPITMTTLAAILTLLPLALAIGAGSGIQQPLAIAIIGGLMLQYPLVLLAMPVLLGLTTRSPWEPA